MLAFVTLLVIVVYKAWQNARKDDQEVADIVMPAMQMDTSVVVDPTGDQRVENRKSRRSVASTHELYDDLPMSEQTESQ